LGLAFEAVKFIAANLPEFSFPHEAAIQINVPVLVFSILVAAGTGIVFGLWPALQLSHPEVSQIMQSNTRKTTGDVKGRRTHAMLIGGQIALTLLMMAGAGAAIEGFLRLAHVKLGYDPHNVMSVGIPVHEGAYKTWPERTAFFGQILAKAAAVPGVRMAAISSNATPPSNGANLKIEIVGKPSGQDQTFRFNMVSKEYFPVLRIPLTQGRIWDEDETQRGAALAVVNQTFVRRYFPAGDAIGHTFTMPDLKTPPPFLLLAPGVQKGFLIIGVIADKIDDGLSKPVQPEAFVPYTAIASGYTQILVRSDGPPLALLHAIRTTVSLIDPDQQTSSDVRDLEHWISREPEFARGQLVAWLFGAFAFLALALASVGLYSVVAYTVVQRTNEFGIRIALGAKKGHVLGIVFRSTATSIGVGIATGIVLTIALNKVMASWAAESVRDPLLLLGATSALALVAIVACIFPAWRASRIEPMTAIRYE
jgi:predicted permease